MRNTKESYICKSVAEFRKSHPDFLEHKEFTGKKKLTVFIDSGVLKEIGLPEDVVQKVLEKANGEHGVKRTITSMYATSVVSEENDLEYWIDIDCRTYNVRNLDTDRIIYSVLDIEALRFYAYKRNIYGVFEEPPVDSEEIDWNPNILYRSIEDLYYRKETKNEMD